MPLNCIQNAPGLDIKLFRYLSDSNFGQSLGQVYGLNLHTAQNLYLSCLKMYLSQTIGLALITIT